MSDEKRNHELGMGRDITRRDFLDGVAVGACGALVGGAFGAEKLLAAGALDEFAPEKAGDYYPPAKMGMRGNHDGTFTFAHMLRDGEKWEELGAAAKTGETYDLVMGGRGNQRAGGGSFLPEERGERCADFDSGQSR
jgi:spermidine dehydrogenase